jgi:hypothetical protein
MGDVVPVGFVPTKPTFCKLSLSAFKTFLFPVNEFEKVKITFLLPG